MSVDDAQHANQRAGTPADACALPSELALAIAHEGGGRVVLVVGAGVSIEAPTNLPSGSASSIEAHRRLVADSVLPDGRCPKPEDLSILADTVFEVTGSQGELVRRLPHERFVGAQPNEGHMLAAALLRERALAAVLTLNFDLAFTNALVKVGAAADVAQIRGPEDQGILSAVNLVYLHRTANHPADEWILRTEALTTAWTNSWEQAISSRVLTAPVVVFAGLGSPAAVLTETARKLRALLPDGVRVFQVDVIPHDESTFASELGLDQSEYLRLGWIAFMRLVAARFVAEQIDVISRSCDALSQAHGWADEDMTTIWAGIGDRGLIHLGQIRARWMLEDAPYLPSCQCDVDHLADLLLMVHLIERQSGTTARIEADGIVEFWDVDRLRWALGFVSARGKWGWGALEPRVDKARVGWRERATDIRKVVVTGTVGSPRAAATAPASIVSGEAVDDIIRGGATVSFLEAHSLRDASDSEIVELLSA